MPEANGPSVAGETSGARRRSEDMTFLLSWLILSVAVYLTAALLPGITVRSFGGAIWAAALYGVLNALLGWLFFAVFAIATLGLAWLFAFLTRWVINAILLLLTSKLTDALEVRSFGTALVGALVMSVIGTLGQWLLLR
jgi:putative membrane protein